jgi:hypothetical protein
LNAATIKKSLATRAPGHEAAQCLSLRGFVSCGFVAGQKRRAFLFERGPAIIASRMGCAGSNQQQSRENEIA